MLIRLSPWTSLGVPPRQRAQLILLAASVLLPGLAACRLGYGEINDARGGGTAPILGAGGNQAPGAGGADAPGAGGVDATGAGGAAGRTPCTLDDAPAVKYQIGESAELSRFHVVHSLDVEGAVQPEGCSNVDQSALTTAPLDYSRCQVFEAIPRSPRVYSLLNAWNGYCLTNAVMPAVGALSVTCTPPGNVGEEAQMFELVCAGDNQWHVVNPSTSLYLTTGATPATALHFQPASGDETQRFVIESRGSISTPVLETSEAAPGMSWRYTVRNPGGGWQNVGFDDSRWAVGPGGFGDGKALASPARTTWLDNDIWLRRSFTLNQLPAALDLRINHDFSAEVYVNGFQVASLVTGHRGIGSIPCLPKRSHTSWLVTTWLRCTA